MSPFETDQKEYESLMGDNPSAFQGGHLPVENISWLNAVKFANAKSKEAGKVLIAYFSWGGNTRGIAKKIQRQTGADVFEIKFSEPYSDDFDTVLMEAQEDQHRQKRPKLAGQVEHMEQYRTILLGYPDAPSRNTFIISPTV